LRTNISHVLISSVVHGGFAPEWCDELAVKLVPKLKLAAPGEGAADFASGQGEDIAAQAELYLKLPARISQFGVFLAFIIRQGLHVANHGVEACKQDQGAGRMMQIVQHRMMMPEQKAAQIVKGYGHRRQESGQEKRHVSLKEINHHARLVWVQTDSIRIGEELRQVSCRRAGAGPDSIFISYRAHAIFPDV
jgi:hypothetical protein